MTAFDSSIYDFTFSKVMIRLIPASGFKIKGITFNFILFVCLPSLLFPKNVRMEPKRNTLSLDLSNQKLASQFNSLRIRYILSTFTRIFICTTHHLASSYFLLNTFPSVAKQKFETLQQFPKVYAIYKCHFFHKFLHVKVGHRNKHLTINSVNMLCLQAMMHKDVFKCPYLIVEAVGKIQSQEHFEKK